jgi:hypothetical protein
VSYFLFLTMSAETKKKEKSRARQRKWREKNKSNPDFQVKEQERKRKYYVKKSGAYICLLYRWKTEDCLGFGIFFVDAMAAVAKECDCDMVYDRQNISVSDSVKGKLEESIENANRVIIVLYCGCLLRCGEEGDLFGWEISQALLFPKKISIFLVDTDLSDMILEVKNTPFKQAVIAEELVDLLQNSKVAIISSESYKEELKSFFQEYKKQKKQKQKQKQKHPKLTHPSSSSSSSSLPSPLPSPKSFWDDVFDE